MIGRARSRYAAAKFRENPSTCGAATAGGIPAWFAADEHNGTGERAKATHDAGCADRIMVAA